MRKMKAQERQTGRLRKKSKEISKSKITIKELASFPELNPNPITEVDTEGTVYYANAAAKSLLPDINLKGLKHPWLQGLDFIFEELTHKKSLVRNVEIDKLWYEQTIYFVSSSNHLRIYGRDITGRMRTEQTLLAQRNLAVSLADTGDLGVALKICVEAAINISEMDCGGLYLVDENTGTLNLKFHTGVSEEFVKRVSHFGSEEAENAAMITDGKPVYGRYSDLKRPLSAAELIEGLRAIAVIPVMHEKKVIGSLNIASHTIEEVPAYVRIALEMVVAHIGSAIVRIKTEEDLRLLEIDHQTLINSIPDYIWSAETNGKGRVIYRPHNTNVERITGYPIEFFMDRPDKWFSRIHPDDRQRNEESFKKLLSGALLYKEDEYRFICAFGKVKWLHVKAVAEKIGDDTFRLYGVVSDITESKRVEEALKQTSQTLQTLFESSPVAIITLDSEANVKMWNAAAERLFGWSSLEVIGRPIPIIPPERIREFRALFAEEMNGREFSGTDLLRMKKDGSLIDVRVRTAPLRDVHGNITGVIAMYTDITERKRAEKAMRESEERLRLAQSYGDVGVWVWNVQTAELYWEPETEALYGLAPGTIRTYKDWASYIHPDDLSRIEAKRDAALARGEPFYIEFRIRHSSGRVRWIAAKGKADYDVSGKILRVMGINIDITERKRTEEAINLYSGELEETNSALKVLLKQRENDRKEMEERVLANVKQLILPHMEILKKSRQQIPKDVALIKIMESNLNEIISSFSIDLFSNKLTPKEILIANLIKEGRQDKDIAASLNLSIDTIKAHRRNIRKKLRLTGKKTNLRAYLSVAHK